MTIIFNRVKFQYICWEYVDGIVAAGDSATIPLTYIKPKPLQQVKHKSQNIQKSTNVNFQPTIVKQNTYVHYVI